MEQIYLIYSKDNGGEPIGFVESEEEVERIKAIAPDWFTAEEAPRLAGKIPTFRFDMFADGNIAGLFAFFPEKALENNFNVVDNEMSRRHGTASYLECYVTAPTLAEAKAIAEAELLKRTKAVEKREFI